MPSPEVGVGKRVALERKLAGLTQRQLARRSGVAESMISRVERGVLPASPAFVSAVARGLGVGVAELLEQPYPRDTPPEHRLHTAIPALRAELAAYRVEPDERIRPRPLDELAQAVARASEQRHNVNLADLGAVLPGLLAELRGATYVLSGYDRERTYGLLAEAYYAAGQLASKLGYIDLSSLTVDRYEWAAAQSGDELAVLVGGYRRAGELIMLADWAGAQRFLEYNRDQIEDRVRGNDPATLAVWGNLHLKSGLAAARGGDLATADAHLAEAHETAQRIGQDRDDYRLCFGPTNVRIWSVSLAVEALDGTEAVKRAEAFVPPSGAPRERVGHHWIDTARGYLLHGALDNAITALQRAKAVAPQQTRYHPMVHETLRTLARSKRKSDPVARLAAWAGIAG